MAHFPRTIEIDGREWLVCPIGGPDCGRALVAFGPWAQDAMDVHAWFHEQAASGDELRRLTGR